ncbi:MAG: T9SS type A sorting domain-containing protein, partial [Bacteroidia bacterium]
FAYYYIDMVSVTEIKPVLAKNDTTAAACDSIVLGANYDDNATYTWWPKTGVNDTTLANPTAQTSVTTTYHVKKVQCSSITYDSITVVRAGACTVGIKKLTRNNNQVAVYPNPNSGSFNINYTGVGKQLTIEVYNMLGALITSKQATIDNSQLLTEITNLNEGVYMLRFIVDGLALKTQRVIVTK